MTRGLVFDIREFAIHDGPGLRTTVFLKGCPLACAWCHNPEGRSPHPQTLTSALGERTVGTWYSPFRLATILNRQSAIFRENGGGVTFSGGEPLRQSAFVAETIDRLDGIHVLLDTSGYGTQAAFGRLARRASLVYFDVKLADPGAHRRWTGRDNAPILANLRLLGTLGTPFVIRVPLVPGVTDTEANLTAIARLAAELAGPGLERVDLLPYNRAAGGKYGPCGMTFSPGYDEAQPVRADTAPFERLGIEVRVA